MLTKKEWSKALKRMNISGHYLEYAYNKENHFTVSMNDPYKGIKLWFPSHLHEWNKNNTIQQLYHEAFHVLVWDMSVHRLRADKDYEYKEDATADHFAQFMYPV